MRKSTRAVGVVVSSVGRGLVSQAGAVLLRDTMRAAVLARAASQPGRPGGGRRGRPATRGKVIADLAAAVAPSGDCLAGIAVLREQPRLAGTGSAPYTPRTPSPAARPPPGCASMVARTDGSSRLPGASTATRHPGGIRQQDVRDVTPHPAPSGPASRNGCAAIAVTAGSKSASMIRASSRRLSQATSVQCQPE